MRMPEPSRSTIARAPDIVARLRELVAPHSVIADLDGLRPYETDGLTAFRTVPLCVVLPETTAEVAAVLKACAEMDVKVVPRGGGTSLSGGALPLADGVILGLSKFKRILDIDYENRCAVVQPGVTNLAITQAVAADGWYYAPDPSSQIACTIGGNVAENSGGLHCLKYGMTTNNILGVELVLMDGTVLRLGGKHCDAEGYDLLGIVTGSEGLLGIVTEVTVRLLRQPETQRTLLLGFDSNEAGGLCVARVIGAGIIPAAMEMMDRDAIRAVEEFCHAGYPLDVESLLIVEVDGPPAEVDHLLSIIGGIADDCGARVKRESGSEAERAAIWAGRKNALPAVGRITPDFYVVDGTIPRGKLPEILSRISDLSKKHGLACANVFHAGDGNLHPMIMYDANKGQVETAEAFGNDILLACVEVGGVLTGEHGVGVEKRDLMGSMFDEIDLAHQQRLKCAFDPDGHLNPGKMFPSLHRCAELGRLHVHGGALPFPNLPRF